MAAAWLEHRAGDGVGEIGAIREVHPRATCSSPTCRWRHVESRSPRTPPAGGTALTPAVVSQPTATTVAGRAEEVTKIYGVGETAVRALNNITVEFAAGHYTAIMGPSGSGKSTLLHCLAGLDRVTAGRIMLGDIEITAC